jgi:hypothetical protein
VDLVTPPVDAQVAPHEADELREFALLSDTHDHLNATGALI